MCLWYAKNNSMSNLKFNLQNWKIALDYDLEDFVFDLLWWNLLFEDFYSLSIFVCVCVFVCKQLTKSAIVLSIRFKSGLEQVSQKTKSNQYKRCFLHCIFLLKILLQTVRNFTIYSQMLCFYPRERAIQLLTHTGANQPYTQVYGIPVTFVRSVPKPTFLLKVAFSPLLHR